MVQDERHTPGAPGAQGGIDSAETASPQLALLADGETARRLDALLRAASEPYAVRPAATFGELRTVLAGRHCAAALVLVDDAPPRSPRLGAIETLAHDHPDLPVLALLAHDSPGLHDACLRAGAQDCLALAAADARLLARALRYAIDAKRAERQIYRLTHYDKLTGLPNRDLLRLRLDQAIAGRGAAPAGGGLLAVALVNLDRFKLINETLGHGRGDRLLQEVGRRLQDSVRDGDTLARFGADEFVALLPGLADGAAATAAVQALIESLAQPVTLEGHEIYVTCCVGVSLYPADGADIDTLVRAADVALSRAKAQGRNQFQLHTVDMNRRTVRRLALENDLRRALDRGEFLLHYQPQMDLRTRRIAAAEALLRWQHPEFGLIPPAEFIPFAEDSGLIVPIGEWVLRAACEQARLWRAAGHPELRVAVNLSSRQFFQENVLDVVTRALEASRLPPGNLELELTESAVMENPDDATVTLCLLANMGVRISIDDFGTGYSSLNHLKRFPIDNLKVDRSFVSDVTANPDDAAIVKAVIAMAHSLRLKVIAEGVETMEQLRFLEAYSCDAIQGYLLSRPQPAADITNAFLPPPGASAAVIPLGLAAANARNKG